MGVIGRVKDIVRPYFLPKKKLLIFNFHQVSASFNPGRHVDGIWTKEDFFRTQIDYLNRSFDIVSLKEALSDWKKRRIGSNQVALTFDDGDVSIKDFIVPYLESKGIPASFFISSSYINSNDVCWTDAALYSEFIRNGKSENDLSLKIFLLRNTLDSVSYVSGTNEISNIIRNIPMKYSRYVDEEFLENLNPDLFSLGLHGHDHHRYGCFSYEWQLDNLKKNIKFLSNYDNYVPIFAIPFGKKIDWNQHTLRACQKLGVTPLFASGGYNTNSSSFGHRIPADSRELSSLIRGLSPFPSKYT